MYMSDPWGQLGKWFLEANINFTKNVSIVARSNVSSFTYYKYPSFADSDLFSVNY